MQAHFVVVDWNRVQLLEEQSYKLYRDRRGKAPFEQLPETNLSHYWVQLTNDASHGVTHRATPREAAAA